MGTGAAELLAATRPGARGAVLMSGAPGPQTAGIESWPEQVPVRVHYALDDPANTTLRESLSRVARLARQPNRAVNLTDRHSGEVERQRGHLLTIAYGMLGSSAAAEDVVQEAFARYQGDRARVRTPLAFLTTIVTRLERVRALRLRLLLGGDRDRDSERHRRCDASVDRGAGDAMEALVDPRQQHGFTVTSQTAPGIGSAVQPCLLRESYAQRGAAGRDRSSEHPSPLVTTGAPACARRRTALADVRRRSQRRCLRLRCADDVRVALAQPVLLNATEEEKR
jgi:Sigma-70 region 2